MAPRDTAVALEVPVHRTALAPLLLVVALVPLGGCGATEEEPGGPAPSSPSAPVPPSSAALTPTPEPSPPSTGEVPADPQPDLLPQLSAQGLGDVRFGMTREEASTALGAELVPAGGGGSPRTDGGCGYLEPDAASGLPAGLGLMVTGPGEGRVTRIDVSSAPWTTDRGIGIGDDRVAVEVLADEGVTTAPSDVAVGVTVITLVPPESAGGTAEVFEVGPDDVVTSFRAGRAEEAAYPEGCA